MLRREDLHWLLKRQRGSRRVGSRLRLGPGRARGEVHPLRPAQRPAVPLHPQQRSVGVADGVDVLAIVGSLTEQLTEQRHEHR
jgi:hypothetical protein